MSAFADEFFWYSPCPAGGEKADAAERYQHITSWAAKARGINPQVFDKLSVWLGGAGQWDEQEFRENQRVFQEEILGRFLAQNQALRAELTKLQPSGLVNPPVFEALERFDDELSGNTHTDWLREDVSAVFQDFSALRDKKHRENFAGSPTGPTGTNTVDCFGFINFLKDCDASVQWTLFMPEFTQRQQDGFHVTSFEYKKMPALRFIGVARDFSEGPGDLASLESSLDALSQFRCGFDYDVLFLHHWGRGVDVKHCRGFWGRFMAPDAPVPEGFTAIDLVPQNDQQPGAPYLSQFAYAVFAGDKEKMHQREGFDSDAMYDVTRNIILGQNIAIPYPDKYWTAEVFLEGFENPSTAYLFSVEL